MRSRRKTRALSDEMKDRMIRAQDLEIKTRALQLAIDSCPPSSSRPNSAIVTRAKDFEKFLRGD